MESGVERCCDIYAIMHIQTPDSSALNKTAAQGINEGQWEHREGVTAKLRMASKEGEAESSMENFLKFPGVRGFDSQRSNRKWTTLLQDACTFPESSRLSTRTSPHKEAVPGGG